MQTRQKLRLKNKLIGRGLVNLIKKNLKLTSLLVVAMSILGSAPVLAEGQATVRDLIIDAHYLMQGALGTGLPPATSELKLTKVEAPNKGADIVRDRVIVQPTPLVNLSTGLLPATAGMKTDTESDQTKSV